MADDSSRDILALRSRLDILEAEVSRLRDGHDDIRRELKESDLGVVDMRKDIEFIKQAIIDTTSRRVRTVDIVVAIVVLIFAGISAYAAVQNNHLTQLMLDLSNRIK